MNATPMFAKHVETTLTGSGVAMASLRADISAVATTLASVLVTGETGVGKGLVAREVHRLSKRRSGRFVAVNCAALAPSVVESELFGHERGAFTGAVERRVGRFELASQGTIFLDEIGDLDLGLQAKLLRVLQDREYERLGGVATLPMTARVIAATNRDLLDDVRAGRFRADLMYRLDVFQIRVPALRDRRDELRSLVDQGLQRLAAQLEIDPPPLKSSFFARLLEYSWPGNIRELMNLLESLLIRYPGRALDASMLDGRVGSGPGSATVGTRHVPSANAGSLPVTRPEMGPSWCDAERECIADVLDSARGNVARAARQLGMPRSTLRYRIGLLGL